MSQIPSRRYELVAILLAPWLLLGLAALTFAVMGLDWGSVTVVVLGACVAIPCCLVWAIRLLLRIPSYELAAILLAPWLLLGSALLALAVMDFDRKPENLIAFGACVTIPCYLAWVVWFLVRRSRGEGSGTVPTAGAPAPPPYSPAPARVTMRRGPAIAVGAVILMAVAFLGGWLIAARAEGRRQAAQEARCIAEAQGALEAYLRGEAGADGPQRDGPTSLDRAAVLEQFGELREITGSQYSGAAWNIQGYHYVTAHRTAVFSKGSVPLKIHVTEGRKTAPGRAAIRVVAIDYDYSNGMTAYVAHPDLVDPDARR